METDSELRTILEADKNKAGGLRKWATANKVSAGLVSRAMYSAKPFPPKVAKKLGYERVKADKIPQWEEKPGKKK